MAGDADPPKVPLTYPGMYHTNAFLRGKRGMDEDVDSSGEMEEEHEPVY